jgi:hypothetical protein
MYSNRDKEYAGKKYINRVGERGGHLQRYNIRNNVSSLFLVVSHILCQLMGFTASGI